MSGFAVGAGSGQSAAIHHTLQRHTEILQDYRQVFSMTAYNMIIMTMTMIMMIIAIMNRQEFNKTASNIAAIAEREDLLSSVQSDISDFRSKQNGAMESLQREMEHTRNSERYHFDSMISATTAHFVAVIDGRAV